MDVANNVWHIAPVPPGTIDHPCPFPEEIPHRLITLYSHISDVVLDPFVGSGQTMKVAHHLGRRWVGYDIIQRYVDYANRRILEPLKVRPQQLVAQFQKIDIDESLAGPGRTGKGSGPRRRHAVAKGQPELFK